MGSRQAGDPGLARWEIRLADAVLAEDVGTEIS